MNVEEIVRSYYSAYEQKEWDDLEHLLAEDFTFTSPNDDDRIDIPTYKARCWPQAEYVEHFELESILQSGDEAFVKYLCTTTKGTSFRNTEYFRFAGLVQRGDRIRIDVEGFAPLILTQDPVGPGGKQADFRENILACER